MELFDKIKAEYPDGIIRNISENKHLYYLIHKELPNLPYSSVKSYLRSLGFEISSESREALRKEIETELSELFPDRIVNASDIYNTPLYTKIRKYNNQNQKIEELFEKLGYTYNRGTVESKYDYFSIKRLNEEYITRQRDITRLLGINRGTLNNIVNGKVNLKASASSWQISYLEDNEEELLMQCIVNKKYETVEGLIRLSIHNNGFGKAAIVIKNEDKIRILFNEDIPDYLRRHMDINRLTYLYPDENELLSSCERIVVLGKEYILSSNDNSKRWNSIKNRGMRKRNLSEEDFCKLIGIYGTKGYEFSDENIIDILSRNADAAGTVAQTNKEIAALNRRFRHYKLEMNDPDYQQFDNWEEYIESFGYHMRGVHGTSQEAVERIKKRIDDRNIKMLENHMVSSKKRVVYVPSQSNSYRRLYNAIKTRGYSNIADYVSYLGFQMGTAKRENGNVVIAS